jgi:hypothetical protein
MNVSALVSYPCTPGTRAAIVRPQVENRISASARVKEDRTELDSHTDTCVVSQNALVFHETNCYVQVSPFSDSLGMLLNVQGVSAALAYDKHDTGETII